MPYWLCRGIDTTHATEGEKQQLQQIADTCNNLLQQLTLLQQAIDSDTVQQVQHITSGNVALGDYQALQSAKNHLQQVIDDYANNLDTQTMQQL